MLVSVDAGNLMAAVPELEAITHDLDLPLSMHAGCAGGAVILLEGDDYTGRSVNLAARLSTAARAHEILATADLGRYATEAAPVEPAGMITVAGIQEPVEVVRFGCVAAGNTVRA